MIRSCADAAVYQARYTNPQPSGGALLLRLMESGADVEASVRNMFQHYETILAESIQELRGTADHYERADDASADKSGKTQGRL